MKQIGKAGILFSVLFLALNTQAAVNMADLVRVNVANNPDCVSWYNINNEAWCSTRAGQEPPVDPAIRAYETQNIQFDQRPWQAVWGKKTPMITTVEYVPAGDNIDNWQELVTSQFVPDPEARVSLKDFTGSMLQKLKDSGLNPVITVLTDSPDQVIFEFRITSPDNLIQDELQKITRNKDGFYILHYATKKADMGDKNRALWLKNLEASTPRIVSQAPAR
ncbi:hypothetical protein [Legionella sp. CNM-4043-24]|uniref:hypothetical protein n=1 Tax=Legionella sp. CNM-4043-24 TaxID=3421646 RepID=UPI00403AADE7